MPSISFDVSTSIDTLQGERGVVVFIRLNREVDQAQARIDMLDDTRAALARRVALLRSDSLDRDILEERARAILNYAREGERVVLIQEGK